MCHTIWLHVSHNMVVPVVPVADGKPYPDTCPALPRLNACCAAKSSGDQDLSPWILNAACIVLVLLQGDPEPVMPPLGLPFLKARGPPPYLGPPHWVVWSIKEEKVFLQNSHSHGRQQFCPQRLPTSVPALNWPGLSFSRCRWGGAHVLEAP